MANFAFSANSEPLKRELLGKRLKELRKEKGLSQQEIANLFRVTRPCVCYWETGKRLPDYQTLITLSEFYKVSVDYLVGRCKNRQNIIETSSQKYQIENILDLSPLNKDNQNALRKFYQYLLETQKDESAQEASGQ